MSAISFFPDHNQELLLQIILSEQEKKYTYWQSWSEKVDFDALKYDTCCVVPTLYKTLVQSNIDSPNLALMKGLSRKFWCKNQLLYTQLNRILSLANSQKIPMLAIRGTAINIAYYKELALRPVEEIDLLVDRQFITELDQILSDNNWQKISISTVNNTQRFLHPKTGVKLDIYQNLLVTNLSEENYLNHKELEEQIINNSQNINFKNHQLKILTPENQLLQVLIQGHNPTYVSPYRWVMDAIQIITVTEKFDWLYFQQIQQQVEQENSILSMLNYLKHTFIINIPILD